jgi:hypothetical protein
MKEIVFVADYFVHDYRGGAELTTEAIIQSKILEKMAYKINSSNVDIPFVEKNKEKQWVICNFASLDDKIKIYLCKNIKYSIVEYDYKFCKYRSMEKHKANENNDCDCVESFEGRVNSAFYGYAERLWFMSERQKNIFLSKVKTIKEEKCHVLSSIFDPADLKYMDNLKDNEKNDTYLILNSGSWIKGTQDCVDFAKSNNLKYELVQNLPYHELLIKMSQSKGLIFMPLGGDTCPRIVIEAKLLGCDLKLNDYVQHQDEPWFSSGYQECVDYLKGRTEVFWSFYE